jgi:hypothetical protein
MQTNPFGVPMGSFIIIDGDKPSISGNDPLKETPEDPELTDEIFKMMEGYGGSPKSS